MAWWIVATILPLMLLLQLRDSEGLSRQKFVIQPHPVQFNEEPHDWTVTEGASVSLTCNTTVVLVIGYIDEDTTPVPKIKWFHNDVMIDSSGHFTINNYGIDTSILTISNVTSLEQGEYYCVVNEWVKPDDDWWTKTRSKSGHITVISNNSILSVNSENHVVLSCAEPRGVPSSGVVWTKDGVEMSENLIDRDGNLLLHIVREENSGYYQCIDHVNNNTLLSYHVTVNTEDDELLHRPQLSTDLETHFITIKTNPIGSCRGSPVNQSITLTCKADGHQEISWYKNGELLDLNSEEITFNQTSGDLVIRREDACNLLGVYQCFASNDIDTVHVSTRVLPFGWPNHPGKPKLISYSSHSNGFTLEVKLYQPDYLGGLTAEDGLRYDIYRTSNIYREDVDASNATTVISIELNSDVLITGPSSLWSVHSFNAQIKTSNLSLMGIAALPEGSPFLKVDVWCDLIDFSVPVVEETCYYNSTSDLITHNISWYMKATQSGVTYRTDDINNWLWYISGGCSYSNGTSVGKSYNNQQTNAKYVVWKLPRGTSCHVSIYYDTDCRPGNSSHNQPCSYINDLPRGNENTTHPPPQDLPRGNENTTHPPPQDKANVPMILVVTVSSILVLTIVIVTSCICYRRILRHKPSAIKMLENAEKLKKLQMSCPISDDQQSVITTQTASDLYTEKVNRWMERLEDITEMDSDSVFEFDASEMLDQIVTGKVVCTQAITPSHYIDYKSLRYNKRKIPTLSSSPTSVTSRSYARKGMLPSIATADSGVESSNEMDWNGTYTGDVLQLHHPPVKVTKKQPTCNSCNGLDHKTPEYDKLKVSNESDQLQRPHIITELDDQITSKSCEKLGEYVGLEVARHQGHCGYRSIERVDDQGNIEMTDQDDYVPESTQRFGEYIESNAVDQSHCHQVSDDEFLQSDIESCDYFSDEIMTGSHETVREPNYNDSGYITNSGMVNDMCNDIVVVAMYN